MLDNVIVFCQSSIKIVDKKIIYFDPYGIKDNYNDADIIFITHDHYDHFDVESINKVLKNDSLIVVPKSMIEKVANLFEHNEILSVDPDMTYNIFDYKVTTIRAYNNDKMFHPKNNNWIGYLLNINNKTYYIMGDTDDTVDTRRVKCDYLFIPIGGTYTMNSSEAAVLTNYIRPELVVPIHYGSIVGKTSDAEDFIKQLNTDIKYKIYIK